MNTNSSFAKDDWNHLAIFGGKPLFQISLHVNQPNVEGREIFQSYLDSAWDARWFTNDGPNVRELENKLRKYLQVGHCVLTSSGTAAMALIVQALNLEGEVIIPSFTFISTPHVLQMAGIKPIFCDIDSKNSNISWRHCEELITPDTSAVIGTHVWGNACNITRLQDICLKENIHLLFDAAHAFGCTHGREPIARFGTAEIFSFHATKTFHTFEGGAITTNDDALASQLRKLRNFGFDGYDRVEIVGTNAKMSEVHAAMGLANLASIDSIMLANKACHNSYFSRLKPIPGITMCSPKSGEKSNYQYIVANVCSKEFGLRRDQLLRVLHAENILARRYFYPGAHQCEPYRTLYPHTTKHLPNTTEISNQVILLPGGTSIDEDRVSKICDLVRFVFNNSEVILEKLKTHSQVRDVE